MNEARNLIVSKLYDKLMGLKLEQELYPDGQDIEVAGMPVHLVHTGVPNVKSSEMNGLVEQVVYYDLGSEEVIRYYEELPDGRYFDMVSAVVACVEDGIRPVMEGYFPGDKQGV